MVSLTRSEVIGAGVDEVHESSTAVELGQEDGGICLRLGAFDPLETWPYTAVFAAALAEDSASITAHTHF